MVAEYVVGSAADQEEVWLRRFLRKFGIVTRVEESFTIYYDNSAAIAYSKNPKIMRKPNI